MSRAMRTVSGSKHTFLAFNDRADFRRAARCSIRTLAICSGCESQPCSQEDRLWPRNLYDLDTLDPTNFCSLRKDVAFQYVNMFSFGEARDI